MASFIITISCNNILYPCQPDFRSDHSRNTNLIDVTDDILSNMIEGKVTGAIFIEKKKRKKERQEEKIKAFDTKSQA